MPTLDFKGKQFVYSHHLSVPFRSLDIDADKSLPGEGGPSLDDNLIIHGDNLHALKALLPKYAGKVDVIYIDPPYNTGNEGWAYNDNVNSPLMRQWLGEIVANDDLERHDKWLCMMWPRITILNELLSKDGIIFVSIDDNEQAHLRLILDEIFGEINFVGHISWESKTKSQNTKTSYNKLQPKTETIYVYSKDGKNRFNIVFKDKKSYPKSDIRGEYRLAQVEQMNLEGVRGRDTMVFDILGVAPKIGRQWQLGVNTINSYLENNDIEIIEGKPTIKMRPSYERTDITEPFWGHFSKEIGTAENAKTELNKIIKGHSFDTVKPSALVKRLIFHASQKNGIVLDSFAGSGTTAHAVQALNAEDGGNRKFILIETEDYADTITAERVRRVIKGVPNAKDAALQNGLGGSFTYCELGDPIDMESFFGGSDQMPAYEQLASYIAYTATGEALKKAPGKPKRDWFIGEAGGVRLHLIYKPDARFMRDGKAALDIETARTIAKGNTKRLPVYVFAAAKYMSQKDLTRDFGITFAQLPYAIHRITGDSADP